MNCQILLTIGITVAISAQGICAPPSYKLNVKSHDCRIFLEALKSSRLATLSNEQFCVVRNSPITDHLPSKHFRDIDWQPYAAHSQVEKHEVAKRIDDASATGLPASTLPRYAESIAQSMSNFDALSAETGLVVRQAELHVQSGTFYALNITRKVCDSSYRWTDEMPMWGIFMDPAHTKGATMETPAPMGQLFYLDGHLEVFFMNPAKWNRSSSKSKANDDLEVAMESLAAWHDSHGKIFITEHGICTVDIHR